MREEGSQAGTGSREPGGNQVAETARKAGASQVEARERSNQTPHEGLAQSESKRKPRSAFGNLPGTKQMEQPRRDAT